MAVLTHKTKGKVISRVCMYCGGKGEGEGAITHTEICPVPKLTKEQMTWITQMVLASGINFPLY